MSIATMPELRTAYREPKPLAHQKVLSRLDEHCRNFIAISPFCVLTSVGADGMMDTSPRGDPAGFVVAPDERTLLLPDRPGNNQVDTLQNVIGNPEVGLLFLVPGMNETLRVSGTAEIVTDPETLAPLSVKGKLPPSCLRVTVKEAFLHCGRAFIRSRLWDPAAQIDRSAYPTYGQVVSDQVKVMSAEEIDATEEGANQVDQLW